MEEKTYQTPCGTIHYWTNVSHPDEITLVFLPGLTADHRLFDKQIQHFKEKYNVVVWDAPAHVASWPFRFDFDLFDKAKWLNDILNQENIIIWVLFLCSGILLLSSNISRNNKKEDE